ncbi:MAG TPA: hypothetical protein VFD70_15950 [Anaerolineae bacterium]|nr:hypothetical protein [Anaerolineae bacterium]
MSLLSRLPLFALLAALAAFTLTLFLVITSGAGVSNILNLLMVLLLALSVGLMFLALNPNNEQAALMLWFGAGVWSAAAYLNFQFLGLLDLVVGAASALSAFFVERESRTFSFAGPALFIGTGLLLVVLSIILSR